MGIFSILASPLGIAMEFIYSLLQNYGWTIIVFTILVRAVMFPLSLKQQKSTARMSAYQPMIQEIQKKWANDKNKQNQEMQKFYEENNIKMTAGCAPMLVNMLVIFGMIAVIQAPLNYILQVPADQIENGLAIVAQVDEGEESGGNMAYAQQSALIGDIKTSPELFIQGVEVTPAEGEAYLAQMEAAEVQKVKDFNFEFAGLDLSVAPRLKFNKYLIMPILSVLTMLLSQIIVMKTNPQQQMGNQMVLMTLVTGVMFAFFAFRVPVGFSLYYTISNIMMLFQQLILRKIYDPAKIRAEVEAEIEERKAAKKAKKKVKVKDESGEIVSLDVSEAELNKMRLAKARELDAKRYAEEAAEEKAAAEAAEKARKLDEEKYGKSAPQKKAQDADDDITDVEFEEVLDEEATEAEAEKTEEKSPEKPDKNAGKAEDKDYKPGRRMRARKKQDGESFVEKEMKAENSKEMEEK